jgi:hypothetical protein
MEMGLLMNFFREWGQFMMMGARALAKWEVDNSNTILRERKRLIMLGLLIVPVIVGGIAFADQVGEAMPEFLGGKRLHRSGWWIRHRPCPDERRYQRHFGRGNGPFSHLCQGHHGECDPQEVGERLCAIGYGFLDWGHHRGATRSTLS